MRSSGGPIAAYRRYWFPELVALAAISPEDLPAVPQAFEVVVDTLDVEVRMIDDSSPEIMFSGYVLAFGLPTSRIGASSEFVGDPVPTLR